MLFEPFISTLAFFVASGSDKATFPRGSRSTGRCGITSPFLSRSKRSEELQLFLPALYNSGTSANDYTDVEKREISNRLVGRPVRQEKYTELLEWLSSNGATVNECLDIRQSSQGEQAGYGVFVNRPIKEGELLFSIPRSLCVTVDKATTSEDDGGGFGEALQKLIEKAGPGGITVAMAGFMAKEYILANLEADGKEVDESEVASSRWGPYLALLPWKRGVNNQEHVLFWNDKKIEGLLEGSLCYREAKSLREEVALSIQVLGPMIRRSVRIARGEESADPFERLTSLLPWQQFKDNQNEVETIDDKLIAEAIKGSFVTLLTRSFQDDESDIEGDGSEKLVPLLDLLQHSDAPNVRHNVVNKDLGANDETAVEVRARTDIAAGSELWNQYRSEEDEAMPYSRFFTRFGFVPGIDEPIENLLLDKSTIFYPQKAEV